MPGNGSRSYNVHTRTHTGTLVRDIEVIVDLLYTRKVETWIALNGQVCGLWCGWEIRKGIFRVFRKAQKLLGDELQLIQFGGTPKDVKPFIGVGSGVIELAIRYASDAYRVVTAVQLGTRIYVLHAFQKKSKRGIETPKRDVNLIKRRYAEAQELAREYEKTKIN
jgi:phage-related protein